MQEMQAHLDSLVDNTRSVEEELGRNVRGRGGRGVGWGRAGRPGFAHFRPHHTAYLGCTLVGHKAWCGECAIQCFFVAYVFSF